MSNLKPIHIEATTLPDAWFQTVYKCLEVGEIFKIDQGSYEGQQRLEFDHITIHIKKPGVHPLLPKIPEQYNIPDPADERYLDDYLPYLMTGELKEGESYTYGHRICNVSFNCPEYVQKKIDIYKADLFKISVPVSSLIRTINQMELFIEEYKKGHRSNQRIIQVAQPLDCILVDPPCLRHIDTRIQDNKLHFFPYFRSWDLFNGFPVNLAAIQMMKEYMAAEIGVDDGEIIAASKGLHLYDHVWELAEAMRGKTIKEFRGEIK